MRKDCYRLWGEGGCGLASLNETRVDGTGSLLFSGKFLLDTRLQCRGKLFGQWWWRFHCFLFLAFFFPDPSRKPRVILLSARIHILRANIQALLSFDHLTRFAFSANYLSFFSRFFTPNDFYFVSLLYATSSEEVETFPLLF